MHSQFELCNWEIELFYCIILYYDIQELAYMTTSQIAVISIFSGVQP